MRFHKISALVFLGCAAFVLGSAQAPPDDDDFAFDGSGFVESWPASTSAPEAATSAPEWYEPRAGSGSGDHSDDEDDYDEDDYVYDYEYDYSEEDEDKPDTTAAEEKTETKTESKPVGVVHSIPPVNEVVHSEHKPTLGAEHRPEPKQPAPTDDNSFDYDDIYTDTHFDTHTDTDTHTHTDTHTDTHPDTHTDTDTHPDTHTDTDTHPDTHTHTDIARVEEPDLVLPPEVTLQTEMEDVEQSMKDLAAKEAELERVLEAERARERELERQLEEERQAEMDGLGTKAAVERDTSFFAQPGILAAVVGGAVVGLLCAILLVMLIVYRMRKKDEGSYPVDEPKRSLTGAPHNKNKEFYA